MLRGTLHSEKACNAKLKQFVLKKLCDDDRLPADDVVIMCLAKGVAVFPTQMRVRCQRMHRVTLTVGHIVRASMCCNESAVVVHACE